MRFLLILILFFTLICRDIFADIFVTSRALGNGRMGNALVAYIHAQWMAYKYGLKFYYQPFDNSENLMCSVLDERLPNISFGQNWQKTKLENIVNLFHYPEKMNRRRHRLLEFVFRTYFSSDFVKMARSDQGFLNHIRARISPIVPLKTITPPKGMLSLAVHVRKGGGWDAELGSAQVFNLEYERDRYPRPKEIIYVDKIFPLTHPPEQYYIDQIIEFSKIHNHCPIYVFIFSDEPLITKLVDRISKQVNLSNITYDYRKDGTGFHRYALEDFFSFLNFKNVIFTGKSTFTSIIDVLGNFDLKIYPTSFHWEYDERNIGYLYMDNIVYERN